MGVGLAYSAPAHATAYAFASDQITNFRFNVMSGSVAVSSGNRNTTNSSTYGAASGPTNTDPEPIPNASDALQSTVGPNANVVGQNDYIAFDGRAHGLIGSRSDSNVSTGSPFVAAGGTITSGGGTGVANVNNVAEVQTGASVSGGAEGRDNANAQFTLTVGAGGATFSFSLNDLYTAFASTTGPGEIAQSTKTNTFAVSAVSSGLNVEVYTPAEINFTGSSINGNGDFSRSGNVSLTSTTFTLAAGTYNLSLQSSSTVSATGVNTPEPASLALIGAGLGALGLVRLRRRS